MRAAEAKELVLRLMLGGLAPASGPAVVDPASPDGDPAKFLIDGKTAPGDPPLRRLVRADQQGLVRRRLRPAGHPQMPFYWCVFAIPARRRYRADHYFVCDCLQMREWVLAFAAPLGNDHRDHSPWRCDLRLYSDERSGYFRWGDEPPGRDDQPGTVFEADNLGTAGVL